MSDSYQAIGQTAAETRQMSPNRHLTSVDTARRTHVRHPPEGGAGDAKRARGATPVGTTTHVSLWRLAGIRQLVAVTSLGFVGFAATLSALPWWAVQGGASLTQAGLVTTAMLATTVATQTAVPAMVRRFGSGRSLAAGLLALGLPSPLLALTSDLLPLLAVSAVRGTGFAVLTVVGSTLTFSLAPRGRHGEAAGIYGLAIGLTSVVVVPGAVAVAQLVGFWPVALLATLPVLAVPYALRMAREQDREVVPAGPAPRHLSAVLAVAVPSLLLLVVTLAGSGLVTFLPIERPLGLLAPAALLLFGATSALSRWRAGLLADRVGTVRLLPASAVVCALGLAGTGAGLAAGHDWLLLAGATLSGVGYGAVQNLTLVAAFARVDPVDTPTASAVWNLSFDGGTAVGAVAVGALATWSVAGAGEPVGIPASLLACAALVLLAAPLGLVRGRTDRAAPAPAP